MIFARRVLWAAVVVSVLAALTFGLARELDDARVKGVPILPAPPEVGTFMYLHVDGPFLLAWDTRTGQTKLCMIQQSGVTCR